MIQFNRKPGLFLTNPYQGKRSFKVIVDITYDQHDHQDVRPLIRAFEHLFTCAQVGPDGKPMKLGSFNVIDGTPFHVNGHAPKVAEAALGKPPSEVTKSVRPTLWERLKLLIFG